MANNSESFEEALGISSEMAERVRKAYGSLAMLAMAAPAEIAERVGLAARTAQRIVLAARRVMDFSPITAAELLEESRDLPRISTGSQSLDGILGGGLPASTISEFSGAYASGKTQIAFQLCVNVQKPEDEGGLSGAAYFVDSEGSFAPQRVAEMVTMGTAMAPKEALTQILVSRAFNVEHQVRLVREADQLIREKNVKLLIVDSVAAHFRVEYVGKDMLPKRQQLLMQHAEDLQQYAESYGIAIMLTNQVLATPETLLGAGASIQPALGYAWGHRPTHRIYLRKGRRNARIARVFDSPELPEREAVFYIEQEGICDKSQSDW
ncbi:MAG: DNA repair and recombination protein RadA [Candidatus Heimdallarchaeota archaeon]